MSDLYDTIDPNLLDADVEAPKIREIIDASFPSLEFIKSGSKQTSYSSDHQPLAWILPGEVGILDVSRFLRPIQLQGDSRFLLSLRNENYRILYSTEADIQALVESYLLDILRSVGLGSSVVLQRQTSLTLALKADIWLVKAANGLPFGVIEVKSPSISILENPRVCGQLFDYMVKLRSSYGQCDLIGIITNLKGWRFGWFPDSSCLIKSVQKRSPMSFETLSSTFSLSITDRKLCMSQEYSISSPELPRVLISSIVKNLGSYYRPVPLFSADRVYQEFKGKTFLWETFPSPLDRNEDLKFSLPPKQTKHFKVLRYFHQGRDGKVALVATNSFHFIVFKYFDRDLDRAHEEKMWKQLYYPDVYCKEVYSKQVLVMPFVFHCQIDVDKKEIYFHFDLNLWGCEGKEVKIEPNPILSYWSEQFQNVYTQSGFTPAVVALRAIHQLASKRMVHKDLEWRHVSLLPVIDRDTNTIMELTPIFIDLTSVCEVETEELALEEMNLRLEEIKKSYNLF